MVSLAIKAAFQQSIALADAFRGRTAPNPPVGAAILDEGGGLIATGAHEFAGAPHAEVVAWRRCVALGRTADAHTLVVTLEPCNHHGRTPPCSELIAGTGIKRVWVGVRDPNPAVCGHGIEFLRSRGLQVSSLCELNDPDAKDLLFQCRYLLAPFKKHSRGDGPWVTVKRALNEMGSMIPQRGTKTFTSPASLTFAHGLRRRSNGILTGVGTILADWPEFTVRRVPDHPGVERVLFICHRTRPVPPDYIARAERSGFRVITVVNVHEPLVMADDLGVQEILVEAGPKLLSSVMAADVWDEQITIQCQSGLEDTISVEFRSPLN